MSMMTRVECGNCGCVFDPETEDIESYLMDNIGYVDCPNCFAYNSIEMQRVYRCDICGEFLRKKWHECDHENDEFGRCHICRGYIDERYGDSKKTEEGLVHEYCTRRKEAVFIGRSE